MARLRKQQSRLSADEAIGWFLCWPHCPDAIAEELMSPAHCNAIARESHQRERAAWIAVGRPDEGTWYRMENARREREHQERMAKRRQETSL